MTTKGMTGSGPNGRKGERGFALVLAILSLMLLTFLGLTLATTTSTELQIATNYRWSQQALYNAEAGLEASRIVLSNVANQATKWQAQLPAVRTGPWNAGSAPAPPAGTGRDYEKKDCDSWGGMGYGVVLSDGTTRYENVSTFNGQSLNGAFTIWIRRPLETTTAGQFNDAAADDALVIVAEGVAPYGGPGDAFTRSHQASRVLETRFSLLLGQQGQPCGLGGMQGQEGLSPMGENYNPCANLTTSALTNTFGAVTSNTGVQ
jgi:hypothetical protein